MCFEGDIWREFSNCVWYIVPDGAAPDRQDSSSQSCASEGHLTISSGRCPDGGTSWHFQFDVWCAEVFKDFKIIKAQDFMFL